MKKLKHLAAVALAATTLTVAGLARPEPASAMTCAEAAVVADYYRALGAVSFWNGDIYGWNVHGHSYWNNAAWLVQIGCS